MWWTQQYESTWTTWIFSFAGCEGSGSYMDNGKCYVSFKRQVYLKNCNAQLMPFGYLSEWWWFLSIVGCGKNIPKDELKPKVLRSSHHFCFSGGGFWGIFGCRSHSTLLQQPHITGNKDSKPRLGTDQSLDGRLCWRDAAPLFRTVASLQWELWCDWLNFRDVSKRVLNH